MKKIKTVMAGAIAMALVSFGANAAENQGQGVVNFKGTVIDAPCGIDSDSVDQTVDFGKVTKSHLANGGISQKNFSILLTHCYPSTLNKGVAVTFTGSTVNGAPTELATAGPTNTAIVINGHGGDITFGTATDFIQLPSGDNTSFPLNFEAMLKQATGKAVAEGDFTAVANFSLSYE
ncbi:fimbrial protein [Escherichia coli]|uniref:fimbrial protein n=1 Tax=Escherichia coli TaxID=562 RepID=UPI00298A44B4|nr:type 1 fimbrial protein [Escherichia coli]HAX4906660.1 type 1 fimbrial protein [Escherichia coli]